MPINIINTEFFAHLRQDGGYYVDKTRFLVDFLQDPAHPDRFRAPASALFTCPRRFGKTLFLNMLAEFFDIRKQGEGTKLFEGCAVSSHEKLCQEWMHQYPVISLTLQNVDKPSHERALWVLHTLIRKICNKHKYLLTSGQVDDDDKASLKKYMGEHVAEDVLAQSLQVLTSALSCHYGRPVILLIDEYDVPVTKAVRGGYYEKMLVFMRTFLARVLTANSSLKFAILTGSLRIAKESMGPALDSVDCYDGTSDDYSYLFGFTQTEVDRMLADAGCEEKRDIIRKWYGGYHFGSRNRTEKYCPCGIMNYLSELNSEDTKPEAYWVNVSSNELARECLRRLPEEADVRGKVARLVAGKPLAVRLTPCMTYADVFTGEENFWTILSLTGYLTRVPHSRRLQADTDTGTSLLAIPNREVRQVFKNDLEAWLKPVPVKRLSLYDALWTQNVQELERQLTAMLERSSVFDGQEDEAYFGLLLGIFILPYPGTCINGEPGSGRCDLIVPDMGNRRAAILEARLAPSAEQLEACVQAALAAAADRNCDAYPPSLVSPRILRVGIAFFQQSVKVAFAKGLAAVGRP